MAEALWKIPSVFTRCNVYLLPIESGRARTARYLFEKLFRPFKSSAQYKGSNEPERTQNKRRFLPRQSVIDPVTVDKAVFGKVVYGRIDRAEDQGVVPVEKTEHRNKEACRIELL